MNEQVKIPAYGADKAIIFDIQHNAVVDGPGIRTTVFFKGCNLRCRWCHNPESQRPEPQLLFYRDRCRRCGKCLEKCPNRLERCDLCGKCADYCPAEARQICGRVRGIDEVMDEILADRVFYETSGGGATFSGGECMLQLDFLKKALERCRENGVSTAVDTAGCVPYSSFEAVIPYTDLFLYDIKMTDAEKHRKYTGADNAIILANLARLLEAGRRVWVRIPVMAGVNDSAEEMLAVRAFFEEHGFPEKTELLPYHGMGEGKYRAMGIEPERFAPPDKERLSELSSILSPM